MTDRLQEGLARLAERRNEHMARTVVYRRPATGAWVELAATVGRTEFHLAGEFGAEIRVVRRDYLINAEDLVLIGLTETPLASDRIEETDGDTVYVYEVMGPGGGEPDWRYSDAYRRTLRVHTKHVGTESAG